MTEAQEMVDYERLRHITEQELGLLGSNELAYIRPVEVENVVQFQVSAGDGRPLLLAPDMETAVAAARHYEFQPAWVN